MATFKGVCVLLMLMSMLVAMTAANEYWGQYGCYEGYCWRGCDGLEPENSWCWTTTTYTESYEYVACEDDSDCGLFWNCAGQCGPS